MTHHYTIEIISKQLFFKVTYRNKKFKKMEHLRGKLDQQTMDFVGVVIPANEADIENFNKKWFKRVNYKIEVKRESLYTQFLNAWIAFYQGKNNIKPKFTGADGNALKQIIAYFKSQTSNDEETLGSWQVLLGNWELLSPFHQKQVDIKYINSKLNVLITEIQQQGVSSSGEIARDFKL